METESDTKRPLGERIRELAGEVDALKKAIRDELDWREESRLFDLDDWDEDDG